MNLKFWDKTGQPRELPFRVKLALSNNFQLKTRDIDPLLFVDKKTESNGERTTLFRVFDPRKVTGVNGSTVNYDDLKPQPDAVLFTGEINSHKIVANVRDVRS